MPLSKCEATALYKVVSNALVKHWKQVYCTKYTEQTNKQKKKTKKKKHYNYIPLKTLIQNHHVPLSR